MNLSLTLTASAKADLSAFFHTFSFCLLLLSFKQFVDCGYVCYFIDLISHDLQRNEKCVYLYLAGCNVRPVEACVRGGCGVWLCISNVVDAKLHVKKTGLTRPRSV